jgi:predicted transcriptional regulator
MVEQLFGSKTRVKLLQLFYGNTNRSFYVREITRKIDEQINSVRRELANLLSIGIIKSSTSNNRLYYEVDQKYQYYDALNTMFGNDTKRKTKSSPGKIQKADNPIFSIGNVELAIYTGIFTKDETSGVDILIVGNTNPTQLSKFIADLEAQELKEIRYVIMSTDEFNYRKQINDRFISLVIDSKKQIVVDKNNILGNKA